MRAVLAASHANPAAEAAVKARKAHMQLYAHNLGILGAMAKGEVDFDAEAAQSAAGNLVMLAGINEASYWVEGSDSMSMIKAALPVRRGENIFAAPRGIPSRFNREGVWQE